MGEGIREAQQTIRGMFALHLQNTNLFIYQDRLQETELSKNPETNCVQMSKFSNMDIILP